MGLFGSEFGTPQAGLWALAAPLELAGWVVWQYLVLLGLAVSREGAPSTCSCPLLVRAHHRLLVRDITGCGCGLDGGCCWGSGPAPSVNGSLKGLNGCQLTVHVRGWQTLQGRGERLEAMEHPIVSSDQGLGEVLMPKLGRVQDYQGATALLNHALASVVLH